MVSEKTEPAELSSSCTVFSQAQFCNIKYHHTYQYGQKTKVSVEVGGLLHIFEALF